MQFLKTEAPTVSEKVPNRPIQDQEPKPRPRPELTIVPKKTNKPPAKGKGSTHKPRKLVEKAILSGADINYDSLQKSTGAGRSTVSSVIKSLSESGLIEKNGKKWELKREVKQA